MRSFAPVARSSASHTGAPDRNSERCKKAVLLIIRQKQQARSHALPAVSNGTLSRVRERTEADTWSGGAESEK